MESKSCRIAVFYDGTYFAKVSNYYLYQHERRARLSFTGLHDFIVEQVSKEEGVDRRHCHIVDAAYFRGRLTAKQAQARDVLYNERMFEDVLMRADIALHQQHVVERNGEIEEKRIDVWLALEAYELATLKRYDVCVLITGDGDFVPLVRKLNTLGSRVMLLAWDFEYERDGRKYVTRASQALIDRVTYPIMMTDEIDSRHRKKDATINQMFLPRAEASPQGATAAEEEEGRKSGVVCSLTPEKGYGFIKPDSGDPNIFFHASETDNAYGDLLVGTAVTYGGVMSTDRGPQAARVRIA